MGVWGTGLYQDDMAADVRDTYKDQLHRGKSGEQITQELTEEYADAIADREDAPIFWFALADTQWNLGRLEEPVKERALFYLHDGGDVRRWEEEDPKAAKAREKVLSKLEQKLLSPQPAEKKVSQYKLYHCPWKLGDAYAYPLDSDHAKEKGVSGRYFLFHKIGETTWWPGHTIPVVRIKITQGMTLPQNTAEFDALEYVQTGVRAYKDRFYPFVGSRPIEEQIAEKMNRVYKVDEFGFLPEYRAKLINTSKRVIPKSIFYVGNFQNVKPPEIEFVPDDELSIYGAMWKYFDKNMIDRYCGYNLRQFKIYAGKPKLENK